MAWGARDIDRFPCFSAEAGPSVRKSFVNPPSCSSPTTFWPLDSTQVLTPVRLQSGSLLQDWPQYRQSIRQRVSSMYTRYILMPAVLWAVNSRVSEHCPHALHQERQVSSGVWPGSRQEQLRPIHLIGGPGYGAMATWIARSLGQRSEAPKDLRGSAGAHSILKMAQCRLCPHSTEHGSHVAKLKTQQRRQICPSNGGEGWGEHLLTTCHLSMSTSETVSGLWL